MGMYAVDTADAAELGKVRDAARGGRAAATMRRRQLSQGKQALNGAGTAPAAEHLRADGAGAAPADPNGQGAPNGSQGAQQERAVPTDAVAAAHFGRTVSKERRRQLSQGKQALKGAGSESLQAKGAGAAPAPNGQGGPNDTQRAQEERAVPTDAVAAAHFGRTVSKERRRQLSQGKQALKGAGAEKQQVNGAGPAPATDGTQKAQEEGAVPTDAVAAARFGRSVSIERRRQLSQGKQALKGAGALPAAEKQQGNGAGPAPAPDGTQKAPEERAVPTDAVAAARFGRSVSMERRRQLSQGQRALGGAGGATPAVENQQVEGAGAGRQQARRAEASPVDSAGTSRPPREGRVRYVPKVVDSPTHGGQRVTGVRIGPGAAVTGGEPGASHPVSGTQYVPADGPAPASGAGTKVGMVQTPKGLVVSGTTVRGTVPITGDEAGGHLPITGEADQRLDDDVTPRRDGTYRSAQFPRRADPKGATAVGTRLVPQPGAAASSPDTPWQPLETSEGRLAVTGTAVGRSGRVTGDEAGACRPITGNQYQGRSASSTECAGTGGGTAPAAHLNRARLDPATGSKVTLAQTWGGQSVTGPSVEYRSNVTGDEPGSCRSLTGTAYQGPATAFGWCEPDEGELTTRRLESKPEGVAVTGDLPMPAKGVTGTERGQVRNVTGTSYYREMRPAEPAGDDPAATQDFPVALARRLAGEDSDASRRDAKDAPPASCSPGRITGAFAVSDDKVTGNREFMFRPRSNREGTQPAVTGEGRTDREITGAPAAWTDNDRVTGTGGYIAAGRNPSEGGGGSSGWAGAGRFKDLATPGGPRQTQNVTGLSGGSTKAAARVTLSGGAQG